MYKALQRWLSRTAKYRIAARKETHVYNCICVLNSFRLRHSLLPIAALPSMSLPVRSIHLCLSVARFRLRRKWALLLFAMAEILPAAYDSKIEGNVIFTRFDAALNWVRKNSLADADGPRVLRNRVNGDGCVAVRHRAVRRGSDALFAATMRRHDRRRHRDLQNGAGCKTDLRTNAGT